MVINYLCFMINPYEGKVLKITAIFCLILFYSCSKKDSSNTSNTSNSTPQPVVTHFSVNGVAANTPIPSADTLRGNYTVGATDATYGYPQLQLTFLGNTAPVSGPYSIVHTATSPFQCSFVLTPSSSTVTATASSGVVTISAATTPNNSASLRSILCTSTGTATATYTVTGTIRY